MNYRNPKADKLNLNSPPMFLAIKDLFFDPDFYSKFSSLHLNKDKGYRLAIEDTKGNVIVSGNLPFEYTFPINPSNISITVPVASNLITTMKGVTSTENGAPLRQISLSGTTGVWHNLVTNEKVVTDGVSIAGLLPNNPSIGRIDASINYALSNSVRSINELKNQANRTANAFSGKVLSTGPINEAITLEKATSVSGFRKLHELKRLLEIYIAGKKLVQNNHWRLVLYMYKDQERYICTLNNYSLNKRAGTVETDYSIALTAWRKTGINKQRTKVNPKSKVVSQSDLQKGIRAISQARRTIAGAHNVLRGIRADLRQNFLTPLAEVSLLIKETIGVAASVIDFPSSLGKEVASASIKSLSSTLAVSSAFYAKISTLNQSIDPNQDLEDLQNANLKTLSENSQTESSSPTQKIFETPEDYPEIFEDLTISSLDLDENTQNFFDIQIEAASNLTAEDLVQRRDTMSNYVTSISEALGGGSSTYSRVKNINSPRKIYKKLTVDDIVLLSAMNDALQVYDSMIASLDSVQTNEQESFYSFYQDYAISEGLKFNTGNVSKFLVPFPQDSNLQQLAVQYLGDPDRWIEIAALNALKAPFVDEVGREILVTASAGGSTLSVGDPDGFFIGQIVTVRSNSQTSSLRKVRNIDQVNAAQTILTFEDVPNKPLTIYKVSDNARIRVFAPNTVNSNMLVAIPSQSISDIPENLKITPEIEDLTGIAKIAKLDFLLNSAGDLVLSGGGEIAFAAGMTNIVQAAILKVRTKLNELLHLQGYGNSIQSGESTAEFDAQESLIALNDSFSNDPRFSGIRAGRIDINGPVAQIELVVGIAETSLTLPISVSVRK